MIANKMNTLCLMSWNWIIKSESAITSASKSKSKALPKISRPDWVMFDNVHKNHQDNIMTCVSRIQPSWLLKCAPDYFDLQKLKHDKSGVTECLRTLWNHSTH